MTTRQIELVEKLCGSLKVEPFAYLSGVLEREIKNYGELEKKEVSRIVHRLLNSQTLKQKKIGEISKRFTVEQINRMFKRDPPFESYGEVTNWHYKVLMERQLKAQCLDHPLVMNCDYEYGWQESDLCADGRLYYLKFYDLLMMDFDKIAYDALVESLKPWTSEYTFSIWKTFNGYHVYIISELINHANSEAVMSHFDCDGWYSKFAATNGYKIRISKKEGRDEGLVEEFVEVLGELPVPPAIQKLLEIKRRFFGLGVKIDSPGC